MICTSLISYFPYPPWTCWPHKILICRFWFQADLSLIYISFYLGDSTTLNLTAAKVGVISINRITCPPSLPRERIRVFRRPPFSCSLARFVLWWCQINPSCILPLMLMDDQGLSISDWAGNWENPPHRFNRRNHQKIKTIRQKSNPSNYIYKVIHCGYIGERMVLFIVSPSKNPVLNDDSLESGVFQGNYEQTLGTK